MKYPMLLIIKLWNLFETKTCIKSIVFGSLFLFEKTLIQGVFSDMPYINRFVMLVITVALFFSISLINNFINKNVP